MFRLSAISAAVILDWFFGEPEGLPHPVCMMGSLISWTERKLRRRMPGKEALGGVFLVVIVLGVSVAVPGSILGMASLVDGGKGWLSWCLEVFWGFQLLAAKSLYQESGKVRKALEEESLERARFWVSRIVGRDVEKLDEEGVTRAAVETVAENASDGVIAPLFFMVLFGVWGGFLYKAVNTMDSMVGYRNERYERFGKAAAKLDDCCNFLPARITGCLMAAAAWVLRVVDGRFDGRNGWRIYCRDRKKHASPNSAHGEAACAGALHIRLAGDAWYFGELHVKPWIGDDDRKIKAKDIQRAGKLMVMTEILVVVLLWLGYYLALVLLCPFGRL